jgi:phosphoribosylaminoimidazole-succinocarboxamide synthase
MTNEWIDTISKRYIELFEKVSGKSFVPETVDDDSIVQKVTEALAQITV